MGLAEELIKKIEDVSARMKTNPGSTVEGSKEITEMTKKLGGLLRQMAKEESEPKFKEQFLTFGNGINDKALQIKILSAVNLAEGTPKNNTQVQAACDGLKSNLLGLVKSLHAAALQHKTTSTYKQADAIRRVAEAFKQI